MASDWETLRFVLRCFTDSDGIAYRKMMGEWLLYRCGKVIGGIYDNRLLVKSTPGVCAFFPDLPRVRPYPGAKEMHLVKLPEDKVRLARLLGILVGELPASGKQP